MSDAARIETDVCVIGAGPAGLTCALYTARAGLDTVVVDGGPSILARNAHLENVPGFPGGVDAREFLAATRTQVEDTGGRFVDGFVDGVTRAEGDDRLVATTADRTVIADSLVAASWKDCSYLEGFPVETTERGTKTFLEVDDSGRTGVDGIYATGRIGGKAHQTVVVAGHGAEVGIAVIHDADVPFYHDWVTPAGYFSDRDRDVPPGCEEIDEAERRERLAASREHRRQLLDGQPESPATHPSLRNDGED
ncbi:FAD-dependent pyridine nucleotide-disulfide oxidoreductase [Salinarchaeum sp. Harcht-Bsk1]|uniref:FAD-dependent oxidoreductase n=1 Tax=Salinarchaeum sp. Harcht-Bsk1 TaxID=1333523 RepID=UPI0003423E04|nr:FAD-dependent oxidoreductase [Salinarchaeum sp. Harcht-Bsk1]AGM99979.1 FAD-dependent pyridine nucleotide-disulfide oxidoreductase [Salinarchaeum sp. Harcht-Bsk1]